MINQATDKTQGEPAIYYYQTNQIDAPLTLTDANQNTVWQAKQNGFKLNVTQADITQPLRYPGQLEDKETGYYYNYHRYYNPNTGRYITSDPIGLRGGMNRFGYVGGNPLNNIDLKGLMGSSCGPSHLYCEFTNISKSSFQHIFRNSELIAPGNRIRKIKKICEKFGGKPKQWKKKKGWDEKGNEYHWYERNGQKYGFKEAGKPDPF